MLFHANPRISVCRQGSITAWIQHAAAVVHHGCTTALEASVARKPVLTFTPLDLPCNATVLAVPNRLGRRCTTVNAVLSELAAIVTRPETIAPSPDLPPDLAARLSLDQPGFAADRMIEVLTSLPAPQLPAAGAWKRVRGYLAVRQLSRQLPGRRQLLHRQSPKREPFRQAEIEQRLDAICRPMAMAVPSCEVLAPDVLLIRPSR